MSKNNPKFLRRKRRIRASLRKNASDKLRLTVFRSGRHIYAQIIDDSKGVTLAASSTKDKLLAAEVKKTSGVEAATAVGKDVAQKAIKNAKVKEVVFDRGGYLYHGRIKALADAARTAGLKF